MNLKRTRLFASKSLGSDEAVPVVRINICHLYREDKPETAVEGTFKKIFSRDRAYKLLML